MSARQKMNDELWDEEEADEEDDAHKDFFDPDVDDDEYDDDDPDDYENDPGTRIFDRRQHLLLAVPARRKQANHWDRRLTQSLIGRLTRHPTNRQAAQSHTSRKHPRSNGSRRIKIGDRQ